MHVKYFSTAEHISVCMSDTGFHSLVSAGIYNELTLQPGPLTMAFYAITDMYMTTISIQSEGNLHRRRLLSRTLRCNILPTNLGHVNSHVKVT